MAPSAVTRCHTPYHSPPPPGYKTNINLSTPADVIVYLLFFLYLLLSWQVVRFAVHSAVPIDGVNSMRSSHVTIQRAVANQGEPLERDHGVLARRHGGGHSGETHVCRLLWKRSNQKGSDVDYFNGGGGLRTDRHSLCLAQVLQRQKGMKATMMKMKAPRTITTMK